MLPVPRVPCESIGILYRTGAKESVKYAASRVTTTSFKSEAPAGANW